MQNHRQHRAVWWTAVVLLAVSVVPASAQEEKPEGGDKPAAVTAADPAIPVEQLKIVVRPLTQDELAVEADAWLGLLRATAQRIADVQIERARIKGEIDEKPDAPAEVVDDDEAVVAEDAETLANLRLQQSALIDRVDVVLDEWELKGGDAESAEKYVTALGGISVDVTDASEVTSLVGNWITSPEGGIRWAKAIGMAIAILIGFWIVAKIVSKLTKAAMGRSTKLSTLMREFIERWVRRIVLIVGFVVALGALGVNIGPLMAAIGALGLVIGLALQGTLSNFASGILILANRPFDVGDYINAGGTAGTVQSVTLFYTVVTSPDNQRIIIPNNSVWGDVITNVTGNPTRRLDLVFGIGYDDDMAKAQKIMEEIVAEHELCLKDPAPVIKVHELGDSSVNFVCRPWVKTKDYWAVHWDIKRRVKERFDAEGVSIPFPQRDVHMYYEIAPKTAD